MSLSGWSAVIDTSVSPGATGEPMTADSPEIVPVRWARMSFAIFIDSITHTSAPADTGVSSAPRRPS